MDLQAGLGIEHLTMLIMKEKDEEKKLLHCLVKYKIYEKKAERW